MSLIFLLGAFNSIFTSDNTNVSDGGISDTSNLYDKLGDKVSFFPRPKIRKEYQSKLTQVNDI